MVENLLGPEPTRLPDRPEAQAAADGGTDPAKIVRAYPDFSEAWALLAERAERAEDLSTRRAKLGWTAWQGADAMLLDQLQSRRRDWAPYREDPKLRAATWKPKSRAKTSARSRSGSLLRRSAQRPCHRASIAAGSYTGGWTEETLLISA